MISIRDGLYKFVCDKLLEPGALVTGIWSDQEFLDAYRDVAVDFVQRTGMFKKLVALVQGAGIAEYTLPDFVMEAQAVFSNEKFLFRGSVDDLDAAVRDWVSRVDTPQSWRDDQLPMKDIQLYPAPAQNGHEFQVSTPNGFFGTLSSVVDGDATFSVSAPFFGTIARNDGTMYLEFAGPMYGTIANIVESKTNVMAVATVKLFNQTITLDSPIELIFTGWLPYIRYGILSKLFSKSGEGKRDAEAAYCAERFSEGIQLAGAVMQEVELQEAV